jgi:hypothetical protein
VEALTCSDRRFADELIEKLIPLVPRPRAHLVRYHAILGPAAKDRYRVVMRTGPVAYGRPTPLAGPRELDASTHPRFNRLPWAVLLKRVFLVDVLECPKCRGRMKLLAAITAPAAIRRILLHLGLPADAPHLARARPPLRLEIEGAQAPSEEACADPPCPDW